MANEIKATVGIVYANGNLADTIATATLNINQTTQGMYKNVVNVSTTEETLTSFADVTSPGYVFLKNCDTVNPVQIGKAAGSYLIKLKAGEIALFRIDAAMTLYLKATTAPVNLLVVAYSD